MSLKPVVAFGILAIALFWGVLYGLARELRPEPLPKQVNPPRTPVAVPTVQPPASKLHYDDLVEQVAPHSGQSIPAHWGDMGQKLIAVGAIDLDKFEAHYGGLSEAQHAILLGDDLTQITLNAENIQFWTNMLWALGLTQRSKALDEGPMRQNEAQWPLGNYASTGGWTLGSKPATELYSSARLVALTPEQDRMIYQVAEHVFRPCCGNSTAFPDCNHGMAVLGLLELLASQGATEDELYEAARVFNAYAFSETYITLAAYFALQGVPWADLSPQDALSDQYSGIQGARNIAAAVGPIPGAPVRGGSCAA